MRNVFPNEPHPRREASAIDEASEWLATLSDPACTAEERREFARWLKRSNTHVKEFLRISALTRQLEGSQAWPTVDVDELLAPGRSDSLRWLDQRPAGTADTPARSRYGWWLATAAVALLAVGVVLLGELAGRSYSTGLGELRSVALEDGSIVQLNAESSIRVRLTASERHIRLERGDAIFKVAHDTARPFRVSTGIADIVAVGTRFNVSAHSSRTSVTVLEGRVRVLQPGPARTSQASTAEQTRAPALELASGEQALVESRGPIIKTVGVDAARVIGWTERRLYFEDTPLAEAVSEFARYSSRTIRLGNAALAERRITGSFDASDPAALVQFLERYGDTTVTASSDGWLVMPARHDAHVP